LTDQRREALDFVVAQGFRQHLVGSTARRQGAAKAHHLQARLNEFAFRWNSRKTNGTGRISVAYDRDAGLTSGTAMRAIVDGVRPTP
jgi:hypothetical protein